LAQLVLNGNLEEGTCSNNSIEEGDMELGIIREGTAKNNEWNEQQLEAIQSMSPDDTRKCLDHIDSNLAFKTCQRCENS